jgi:hypothetical protein
MTTEPRRSAKKQLRKFDLTYFKELEIQEQRAATFYEYARHSSTMTVLIAACRKEAVFSGGHANPDLLNQILKMTTSDACPLGELLMLAESEGFPSQPFNVTAKYEKLFGSATTSFGVPPIASIPWQTVDMVRAEWRKTRQNEHELLSRQGWLTYGFPWSQCTNQEVVAIFGQFVQNLRPRNIPEPSRAGRKGRSRTLGTGDMINQLSAYRLDYAGFNFSNGARLVAHSDGARVYRSEEGWRKAICAAKRRIDGMMNQPFFGSSPEVKSPTK